VLKNEIDEIESKDPAFLLYSSDFLTGVAGFTDDEVGKYIKLLCLQHQKGCLSEKTIRLFLRVSSLEEISDVLEKFKTDENGNFYNVRLEKEIIKRAKHLKHQSINGKKGGAPKGNQNARKQPENKPKTTQDPEKKQPENKPLENEDVIEDEDINKNEIRNVIIEYLNGKAGTNYKPTSTKTNEHINARLAEGFTLDDFKSVIDNKVADWLENPEMSKYLRPETLFGRKFEGYLNQQNTAKGGAAKNGTKSTYDTGSFEGFHILD